MEIPEQSDEISEGLLGKQLPDWDYWRQRNGCRLWAGVMLSMNWEPSASAREWMRANDPDAVATYQRRLNILKGVHGSSELPVVAHALAGRSISNKWLVLNTLLAFGKKHRWQDIATFEAGMTAEPLQVPAGDTNDELQVVESVDIDDLEKGHQYTILRFGALLSLVESWLLNKNNLSEADYLNGNRLNFSAIGKKLEEILSKPSSDGTLNSLKNCKAQVNSKRISEAYKSFVSR
jgi:hypothetical protein